MDRLILYDMARRWNAGVKASVPWLQDNIESTIMKCSCK